MTSARPVVEAESFWRAPAPRDVWRCGKACVSRLQSTLFPSWRFLGALEELYRMPRHNGRNGVLVDELRMPVATQKHAEIIEPSYYTLQFHAIHQKDGEWNFVFTNVIEKGVLKVLCAVGCHGRCSVSLCRRCLLCGHFRLLSVLVFSALFLVPQTWAQKAWDFTIRRPGEERCKSNFGELWLTGLGIAVKLPAQ
jgi:hypothetical protein